MTTVNTQLRERLKRIPWYRDHIRKLWFAALIAVLLLWLAVKFLSTRKTTAEVKHDLIRFV